MSLFNWISNLFTPATKLIETLDVSGNKKNELLNELAKIQEQANSKLIELEKISSEALTARIQAESQSDSLIAKNWRPACSILLVICLVLSAYGIGDPREELWRLAEIIIGVAGGGRSLEKIASVIKIGKR